MNKLGALPTDAGSTPVRVDAHETRLRDEPLVATGAQIHQLDMLLWEVGLDPRASGMDLAVTRDGRWLWMTVEEAAMHDRPEVRIVASGAG